MLKFDWELIYRSESQKSFTSRAKVFGGWIIITVVYSGEDDVGNDPISQSMAFIPDCTHSWEVEKNIS